MKIHEYNEMMAYLLRPATGDRENFAIGGGVVKGQDLGSREGFEKIELNLDFQTEVKNLFNQGFTNLEVAEKTGRGISTIKRVKKLIGADTTKQKLLSSQEEKYTKLKNLIEKSNNQFEFVEMQELRVQAGLPKRTAPSDLKNYEKFNISKLDKAEDKVKKVFSSIIKNPNTPVEEIFNITSTIANKTGMNTGYVSTALNKISEYKDFKPVANKLMNPAFKTRVKGKNLVLGDVLDMVSQQSMLGSGKASIVSTSPERFIINSALRHVNQGGNKIEFTKMPGALDSKGSLINTTDAEFIYKGKKYNYDDIAIKGRKIPVFKEVYKSFDDMNNLLNKEVIHPVTKQKINFKNLMSEAYAKGANFTTDQNPYNIDHFKSVKQEPFSNLRILPRRINQIEGTIRSKTAQAKAGFLTTTAKDYKPEKISNYIKKIGYNFTKDIDKLANDEIKLANDILVKNRRLRSPLQIAKEYEQQKFENLKKIKGVTTADKIDRPAFAKEKTMFDDFGSRTSANPFFDPQVLKQGALDTLKVLGTPTVAAGFAGSTIKKNLDEGQNFLDAATDKMVGVDLLYPEVAKQTVGRFAKPTGKGILSTLGRVAMNPFGRAARAFTPVGAGITAIGLGKDYYDFAKDEIAKVKEMSPEERNFYNDLLMDEGGLLDW